jgi:hypothetical protein
VSFDPFNDPQPPPANVPGLPVVTPRGAGARSGWAYTPELGAGIAALYADVVDGGLWALAAAYPDTVPPPAIVRAWCKQFPAFGTLMRQADALRAEQAMEQTIVIADSDQGNPARVALRIGARVRMAERLDAARWGQGATPGATPAQLGHDAQPTAVEYSDAALVALIEAERAASGAGTGGGTPR